MQQQSPPTLIIQKILGVDFRVIYHSMCKNVVHDNTNVIQACVRGQE